jgi:hypothetical protein
VAAQESIIASCEALATGDEIEAWHNSRLLHKGRVSRTLPTMGMFWIICARTGTRKLVDLEATKIIRVSLSPETANPEYHRPDLLQAIWATAPTLMRTMFLVSARTPKRAARRPVAGGPQECVARHS